jgi:hypothetical protein
VIEGLKATAVYYAQERDRRKKEMGNRYALIDEDELARNVAVLNERIETRVTQSLEIASSLMQQQQQEGRAERYRDTDAEYGSATAEHRNAERDVQRSSKIKGDLAVTLRASIDKLSRDVDAREAELRTATDPAKKERLSQDIQTMRGTIEARRAQIDDLVTAPAPSSRPVSREGAFELDKMLGEMSAELKQDFAKFKSLVKERDAACARVKPLKVRLEQATAQLDAMGSAATTDTPAGAMPQ